MSCRVSQRVGVGVGVRVNVILMKTEKRSSHTRVGERVRETAL